MKRIVGLLMVTVLSIIGLSILTTPSAEAVVGAGKVRNMAGSPVWIRCDWSSSSTTSGAKKLYEYGNRSSSQANSSPFWHSDSYCTSDTDQFRSSGDDRCMYYRGPGYTDGYYKLKANVWRKVSDLATVSIYAYGYGSPDKCAGRPWYNRN